MHLLLVEDDDGHALLMTQALRDCCGESLTLDRAHNGTDAIAYLRRFPPFADHPTPHLVLLDMKLPGKTGLDVLAAVKGDPMLRAIPIAILSTSNAAKDRQRAYAAHANAYLVKPTDFDGFRALVRSICCFWGQWNRPLD